MLVGQRDTIPENIVVEESHPSVGPPVGPLPEISVVSLCQVQSVEIGHLLELCATLATVRLQKQVSHVCVDHFLLDTSVHKGSQVQVIIHKIVHVAFKSDSDLNVRESMDVLSVVRSKVHRRMLETHMHRQLLIVTVLSSDLRVSARDRSRINLDLCAKVLQHVERCESVV